MAGGPPAETEGPPLPALPTIDRANPPERLAGNHSCRGVFRLVVAFRVITGNQSCRIPVILRYQTYLKLFQPVYSGFF